MLILLLTGIALSELYGSQRMQAVLSVESTQAFWIAEAGIWHSAHQEFPITSPVAFASGTYTVVKSGNDYSATALRNNATRVVNVTLDTSLPGTMTASPVAHWKLDEGTGQTAADSAPGGSHPGTLGATAGVDASDPEWMCAAAVPALGPVGWVVLALALLLAVAVWGRRASAF